MARKKSYNLILYELQQEAMRQEALTGKKVTSNMALQKQAEEEYIAPIKNVNPANRTSSKNAVKITNKDQKELKKVNVNDYKEKKWYEQILQTPKAFKNNLDRFNDGYQFGDLTKTVGETIGDTTKTLGGSVLDLGAGIVKGAIGVGESWGELGAGLVAEGASLIGQDDYAERLKKKIADNPDDPNRLTNKISKWQKENVDDYSIFGNVTDAGIEGVGQAGAYWATGQAVGAGVGALSKGLSATDKAAKVAKATKTARDIAIFTSAAGGTLPESYSEEDAETWQVWTKALGTGYLAKQIEALGGIFSEGGLDEVATSAITENMKSSFAKVATRWLGSGVAEGGEEGVEYVAGQLLDRGIDTINSMTSKNDATFAKDWDWDEFWTNVFAGAIAGTSIGAGQSMVKAGSIKASNPDMKLNEVIDEVSKQEEQEIQIRGLQEAIEEKQEEFKKTKDPRAKQIIQETIKGLNEELNEIVNAQQITEKQTVEQEEQIEKPKNQRTQITDENNNVIEFQRFQEDAENITDDFDYNNSKSSHKTGFGLAFTDNDSYTKGQSEKDIIRSPLSSDKGFLTDTNNQLSTEQIEALNNEFNKYIPGMEMFEEGITEAETIDLINKASEIIANAEDNNTGKKAWDGFYNALGKDGYVKIEEDGSRLAVVKSTENIDNLKKDKTQATENNEEVNKQQNNSVVDNQGREVDKDTVEELKDSKVRDDKGNLLTVYHGTPNGGFTEFDISKRGTATDIYGVGDYGKGFYFTPVKEGAESYTKSDNVESKNPQVYETYLNLKNPLRLDIISSIQKDINALSEEYGALNIPDVEIDKVYEKYNITEEQYDEMSTLYDNLGDNWQDIDISEYGYDGIINENRTEYVAFDPKQIKILNKPTNKKIQSNTQKNIKKQSTPTQQEIENLLDIQKNKSGSEYARAFFALRDKYGQANLYKALNEAYSRQKAGNNEVVEQVEETIAPIQETMEQLDNKLDALQKQLTEMQENVAPVSQDVVEKQGQEAFNTITDKDAPSFEDVVDEAIWDIPFESDNSTEVEVKSPLDDRDIDEVGNRSIKAYQYENPEVKPYFQEEAQNMLYDLDNTIKGERGAAIDELGNMEYYGITRQTTEAIAYLKDNYGYSYDQIRQGLNKIIEDDGKENNAVSKRIEFMLDERLREGYTTSDGIPIPANQDYVNFISEKQITEYNKEAFNAITDEDIPMYEKIEPRKQAVTGESTQVKQTTPMKLKTAQNGNTDVTEAKQRKWVKTSTESEVVNREILPDDLDQSKIFYQPITNKATLNTANVKLDSLGYEKAVEYFNNQILNKTVKVEDIALGERLIQEAIKNKDTKTAGELIQNVAILGTELGQKVQALSIIQRMTPEGQLKMLEKTINRGKAKGDKSFTDVEVTDDMRKKILDTYNEDGSYNKEALDKAVEDVKQEIADQMTPTLMDKINDWRYFSMLGNPKTHIRNLVSNVAMKGTMAVKNAVARTIESIAPIKNRTKTWKTTSQEIKDYAQQTALEMKDVISGDSKYSETADIKSKRKTFNSNFMNWLTGTNSNILEVEDWLFSKSAFKDSLSEFLTANGIETKQDIEANPELVEKGKQYALEQSQIATFRQYSWLSNKIREIENKNAATQIAVGAVLPFKKTPINIAKTGLSYSPLGFIKTLTYDVAQVKKGNMEASTLIDHIAQNTTGTALTLVGYMLAQAGFLNGAGDDDKEGKYDYQLGKQSYSINIGGSTYSLSWLSPVAMPLFVGANAYEQLVEGEEWNADVVLETLGQTLDPLSEMSFLSSLDSVLSSYDSGVQRFFGIGEAMVQNYVTQFVPTASSQLAATLDDTKRSTKVSGDSTMKVLEETYNKLIYKIPGIRETLQPTTDIWGNEVKQNENLFTRAFENFIAPYARKDSIATEIDEELKDLYSQTGDTGILPSIPSNYVNYDGEKYNMSAEEYTDYKKIYGQTANDLLEDLFRTTTYKNATSEERTDMVNDVYDYARDEAKLDYLAKEGVDYTNATEDKVEVYKENLIKGAIENDMTTDEYGLYVEDPEEYKFLMEKDYDYRRKYFDTYDSLKELDKSFEEQKEGTDDDDELDAIYSDKKAGIIDKIINSGLDNTEKASLYKKYYNSDTVDTIMKSAINIDDYLVYETKEFKADKNAKGNSIPGSRKEKVEDYVFSIDGLNTAQKAIIIKATNTFKYNDYNEQIVRYVDGLGLSFEEVRNILEDLDMKVTDDGNVYWD